MEAAGTSKSANRKSATEPGPRGPGTAFKSPLLLLAACFALGIVVARSNHPALVGIPVLLTAVGVCLLAGLLALGADWRRASSLLVLAGFVFAGAAAGRLFEIRFPPNHIRHLTEWGIDFRDPLDLEGTVLTAPERTPYGDQFDLEACLLRSHGVTRAVTGKLRLRLQASEDPEVAEAAGNLHLQCGDSIRAVVRLRRPRLYRNPGAFDYRRYMESIEDVYWEGSIPSAAMVEKLAPPVKRGYDPASWPAALRARLLAGIEHLYPVWSAEGRNGAVLAAVLLGERGSLDSDIIDNFRRTGLYHLLVIAGLHVGLLALLAEMWLRLFRLREYTRSLLLLAFLLTYASLVEQRAPTLRATLMITAYLLARFLYRRHVALNAIGLAALLLLLVRPPWLFESGFQLSFSAALLIAGLAAPLLARTTEPYRNALEQIQAVDRDPSLLPRLAQFRLDIRSLIAALKARIALLDRYPDVADALVIGPARALVWTVNIVLFSAVLQVGLLMPMAVIFHRVTFAGIILNALAIPVMTVLLAVAVPVVVLAAVALPLALWAAKLVSAVLGVLFYLTELPNLPAWLSYRIPDPPGWVAWGFALSLVAAACALNRSPKTFVGCVGAGALFAALLCVYPFASRLPRGVLEVTALDCGGGNSLLVVLPDQATLLFGACGGRGGRYPSAAGKRRWDPGENIVSPYLWSRRMQNIDVLVLADAHGDHMAGLRAVVENFRVREFWHGEVPWTPAYEELAQSLRQRGVRSRQVAAGDAVARGSTSVQILWPPATPAWSRDADPDDAVVARIADGVSAALLSGDLSREGEKELVLSKAMVPSQVLEVTHQGAKSYSSPEFLARVSPQVALVSGDSASSRRLPNPETLERLKAAGARVLRPDLDGAITVEMNGSSLAIHEFSGASHPQDFSD